MPMKRVKIIRQAKQKESSKSKENEEETNSGEDLSDKQL